MLFEPGQFRLLQGVAQERGQSVSALIRQAVQATYLQGEREQRFEAVRELAAMNLPIADWEQIERESVERWTSPSCSAEAMS